MSYGSGEQRTNGAPVQNGYLRTAYPGYESYESDIIAPSRELVPAQMFDDISDKQVLEDNVSEQIVPSSRHSSVIDQDEGRRQTRQTQLSRKLRERHVNMFAFSLLVGSGLFLQSGRVINLAGPGAAFLAYPIMILIIWAVMGALGEMTALFPVPGALFELPARFLDESIGYAAGWMAWFSWVVIFAAELLAIARLFKFEFSEDYLRAINVPEGSLKVDYPQQTLRWGTCDFNPAIWISLFLPLSVLVNLLPVKLYGEYEYCVGVIKMVFCVVLIVFQMVINIQQNLGARYYQTPFGSLTNGYLSPYGMTTGGAAKLEGIWSGFCTAIYSMIGFESISITAAESREFDERKNFAEKEGLKISTRKIAIRILMIYTLSTFIVGFNVPANDQYLVQSNQQEFGGGENSAFVIAAVRAGKTVWPSLMTSFFIFTTTSASINSLYLASRLLHALALSRPVWPEYKFAKRTKSWLEQVTRNGVPRNAIMASSAFGLLGYLACGNDNGRYLSNLAINSVVSMLIVYIVICATFWKFKASLKRKLGSFHSADSSYQRGDSRVFDRNARTTYPYKSRGQPLRATLAGLICALVVLLSGWSTFHPFRADKFVASYISIVVFGLIWLAYRFGARTQGSNSWGLRPTEDMSRPTRVQRSLNNPGRDHLNLDIEHFWSVENAQKAGRWLWVWLK